MANVRVVSLGGLRRRLGAVLDTDSLLFARFDAALRRNDEKLLEDAFRCLRAYPEATRRAVEDALLAWLFDESDNSGLVDLDGPSRARH